ncbi:methyltransferase domain-containing protein [Dechloromonas sp. TW-R-39-2]|uniref:class I SAM-dependent methyltransferase n=1 Tax=Dechloromonas sp. TW-R-39-2 TaxID=2654218 RepID=UPI00193C8781|nr:class I SAM-dependent methyltransferase [Dechloromonas sp. TW-R-39-2]QRM18198.1 methyltransferase domain-containing protein [Dechloromonas sp. TW-R-39-2]
MTSRFLQTLLDDASRPFRNGSRFAYHYARGKLSSDCIFRELLKRGIFPAQGRFLDLGCGQGSLFAWLLAARKLYEQGNWPADWAPAPQPLALLGYELMQKDVDRASQAFGLDHPIVSIRQGDMCKVDFGQADVVTILDALHYVDHARQKDVLKRIRAALPPGGLFLTRVGDKGAGLPYHICNWVDHAVTFVRGHRLPTLYGRKLVEWVELLKSLGFVVETLPMNEGKPFANIMLICRVPAA